MNAMKPSIMKLIVCLFCLIPFFGCDKVCTVQVNEVSKVTNLTQQDIKLMICTKGLYSGKKAIAVSASQAGDFLIGSHSESKVYTGGPSNACDTKQEATAIALSTENFNQFKFCYSPEIATELSIVSVYQNCPEGTFVQQMPSSDCQ